MTSKDRSAAIYGDSVSFRLATLSVEVGAKSYTVQEIGRTGALDDAGMRDFTPTQSFGNFTAQTITDHIRRLAQNLDATYSVVSKRTGRYRLFLTGLFLTALGSTWYHLAPDNARLVWDRLPIALACAGLLAGVMGDVRRRDSKAMASLLALAAVASVAWWYFTDLAGNGDLRPYLLLQGLPILLIPLWQWIHKAPAADRLAFGGALAIYIIAKLAELNDHAIAIVLDPVTGHTLKHLLATGAAALIVGRLVWRVRAPRPACAAACRPARPSAMSACR